MQLQARIVTVLLPLLALAAPPCNQARGGDAAPGDNAAPVYRRAFLAMPEDQGGYVDFPRNTDDATVQQMREQLERYKDALALFRDATLITPIDWGAKVDFSDRLPHLSQTRRGVRLLAQRTHLRDLDGDFAGALEDAATILRAGRHLMEPGSGQGLLVDGLVGIAMAIVGHGVLGELATTPERAARIETLLAQRPPFPERLMLAGSLTAEKEVAHAFFAVARDADGKVDRKLLLSILDAHGNKVQEPVPEFDADRLAEATMALYAKAMERVEEIMALPVARAVPELTALRETGERRQRETEEAGAKAGFETALSERLSHGFVASIARASMAEVHIRAGRAMVRAGTARLRGAAPEELARFVDPLEGRPFRYIDDAEAGLYVVCDGLTHRRGQQYLTVRLGPLLPEHRVKRFGPAMPDGELPPPPGERHGPAPMPMQPPPAPTPTPVAPAPEPRPAPLLEEEFF